MILAILRECLEYSGSHGDLLYKAALTRVF